MVRLGQLRCGWRHDNRSLASWHSLDMEAKSTVLAVIPRTLYRLESLMVPGEAIKVSDVLECFRFLRELASCIWPRVSFTNPG